MPPTDPPDTGITPEAPEPGNEPVSDEATAARLAKLRALQPGGETGEQVRVAGRVMTVRRHGKVAFADLQDQSGRIQLFAQADRLGDRLDGFAELDIGDWVGAWGEVVTTRRGELSVRLDGF